MSKKLETRAYRFIRAIKLFLGIVYRKCPTSGDIKWKDCYISPKSAWDVAVGIWFNKF